MAAVMTKQNLESAIPEDAFHFAASCEFVREGAEGEKAIPVTILARSGEPLVHWYWGRCVHDFDGMQIHKKSLPIDYSHDYSEVLGFLNQFDWEAGDLIAKGEIVPFSNIDRASEVYHKAKQGVPYEASISFDMPEAVEEVGEGAQAEVNGRVFQGPILIFRKWNLRGVAICPYGYDRRAETKFKRGDLMGKMNEHKPEPNKDESREALKAFTERFGKENGLDWFLEGLSMEEATAKHQESLAGNVEELAKEKAQLSANVEELTKERDDLKAKMDGFEKEREDYTQKIEKAKSEIERLSALVDSGEKPVEFGETDPADRSPEDADGLDCFAAKIEKELVG